MGCRMKVCVLFWSFISFQYCVAFVINRNGIVIQYDITSISKCQSGGESVGRHVGGSLADCVLECGLREHCGSLSYSGKTRLCEMFTNNSKENLTTESCMFVSKTDIKVEKVISN